MTTAAKEAEGVLGHERQLVAHSGSLPMVFDRPLAIGVECDQSIDDVSRYHWVSG
jgi:hypothetical protein